MCQQEMEVEVTDGDEEIMRRGGGGGGLINGDCHVLIALFRLCVRREIHSNDLCVWRSNGLSNQYGNRIR